MARKFENELGQMRTDRGLFIDKGNLAVSVKHPDFNLGAKGDSINDDGVAFNLAVAHLPTEGGTVIVPPGDYLLTTAFTFGSQDNVMLWLMPGVVLTGSVLPTATGNNFILDWRAGNVDTSIAGTATGDITRVNITAGTGLSGTVDTTTGEHTQTLAISGYTGETSIVTLGTIATGAVPASLVTAGTFGTGAYSFDNNVTVAGVVSVDDATESTSTTTGSIHTDGGLGVVKNTFLGGTVTVAGVLSVDDTTDASSVTVASIHTDGGLGVAGEIITTGKISIGPNTAAPVASGADLYIEDLTATIVLNDTNAALNEKVWHLRTDGAGNLEWNTMLDDFSSVNNWMIITRTAGTVDLIKFLATEIQLDAGATGVRTSTFFHADNNTSSYKLVAKEALDTASTGTILRLGVSSGTNWASITISESAITTTVAGPLTVVEAATFTGAVSVDDTTESTSGTTGSIHTDGGIGVAKDLIVGSQVAVGGAGIQSGITLTLHGNGVLSTLETTTPTANTNFGAWYTKSDNKAYFQDGAGVEHEIAFV